MTNLQKALDAYIKEKHTQEECVGFVAGYEAAKKEKKEPVDSAKKSMWAIALGCVVLGAVVSFFNDVPNIAAGIAFLIATMWCGLYGLEKYFKDE